MGLLIRLVCVQGLHSFNLLSGGLLVLMSFSGSFNLASGGFLAAPPLSLHPLSSPTGNCSNLPFGTQEGHGGWSLFPTNKKRGTERPSCPAAPQGPAWFHLLHGLFLMWTENVAYHSSKQKMLPTIKTSATTAAPRQCTLRRVQDGGKQETFCVLYTGLS